MRALTRRNFIVGSASFTALLSNHKAFPQSSNLTDLTISEASRLIRTGAISPVELTQAYLDRISDLNPHLNAFITVTEDLALDIAYDMEEELSRGNWRGPLHGIPLALKDNIDTAGTLTTAASEVFANRTPSKDAEVVLRLKKAGAVPLGKLNMHEFAAGGTSDVSYFGPVHNPWDLNRIPGGSSGGSGAAVAARLCAGALGTDTGGSIRSPAAYCGIVGLKPTYGLTSIRGIVPYGITADCVGPMTRSVSDAATLLQVMSGYDSKDIASIEADIPSYIGALSETMASLRIGVPRELGLDYRGELDRGPEGVASSSAAESVHRSGRELRVHGHPAPLQQPRRPWSQHARRRVRRRALKVRRAHAHLAGGQVRSTIFGECEGS